MADIVAAEQVVRRVVRLEVGRDGPPDALAEQGFVAVDKAVRFAPLPQLQAGLEGNIPAYHPLAITAGYTVGSLTPGRDKDGEEADAAGTTFGVLEQAGCPAVLAEQCFVTNAEGVAAFAGEEGCRRAAEVYYRAICRYFGTQPMI